MNCVKSKKCGVRTGVCRAFCQHSNVESYYMGEDYHGIHLDQ